MQLHLLKKLLILKYLTRPSRLFMSTLKVQKKYEKLLLIPFYSFQIAEDLLEYMEKRKAENNFITVPEAATICLEVADIILPLHTLKVVHRNIKMSNILKRKSDGKLILCNFLHIIRMFFIDE